LSETGPYLSFLCPESEQSLFIFPAFGGTAAGVARLAKHLSLSSHTNVFALDYPHVVSALRGLELPGKPPRTMGAWAHACAERIVAIHHKHFASQGKPFSLTVCGISIGGAVATEAARMIKQNHKNVFVSHLSLVDTPPHTILTSETSVDNAITVILALMASNILYGRVHMQDSAATALEFDKIEHELGALIVELGTLFGETTDANLTVANILEADESFLSPSEQKLLREFSSRTQLPLEHAQRYYTVVRTQALCLLVWNPDISKVNLLAEDTENEFVNANSSARKATRVVYIRAENSSSAMSYVLSLGEDFEQIWTRAFNGEQGEESVVFTSSPGNHFTAIISYYKELTNVITSNL
jgi:pimeloyl-ACP methyl ester carboxylesterase